MALIWASRFVLCPPVLGLLHWCTARRFLLHGPNLGIVFVLFSFCALLCWVSFIGVLHGGFL